MVGKQTQRIPARVVKDPPVVPYKKDSFGAGIFYLSQIALMTVVEGGIFVLLSVFISRFCKY